jgi:hypothetical protein
MEITENAKKILNTLGAFSTVENFAVVVGENSRTSIENNDFYSLEEVAHILSKSISSIRDYIRFYKLDGIKKSNIWQISSNEIAKLIYKKEHMIKGKLNEQMLVIYDANLKTGKIFNYHFVTVQDVINQINEPSLNNIIQFFHSFIPEPMGTVYIDPIFLIGDFFVKAEILPPRQQLIENKFLYRSVVDIINLHSIELVERLKQAYQDSIFFTCKENSVIQVYVNSSGDLRHALVNKEHPMVSEDEYLFNEFECQDIFHLLKGHHSNEKTDIFYEFINKNGLIKDFVQWLIENEEISEDVPEGLEEVILKNYFSKKEPLSLLKTFKAWDREKYFSVLNELFGIDEKVIAVLKEIVMRKEFAKEKWKWVEKKIEYASII